MDESHVGNYAASSPTPGVSSPAASSPTPGVSDERIEKSVLPDHGRAVPRDPAYARTHLHDTSNGHTLCFKNLSTSITAAHIEELFVAKQIPAPKRLEIHYSGHVDFKGTAFARFGSASVGRFQQENHKSIAARAYEMLGSHVEVCGRRLKVEPKKSGKRAQLPARDALFSKLDQAETQQVAEEIRAFSVDETRRELSFYKYSAEIRKYIHALAETYGFSHVTSTHGGGDPRANPRDKQRAVFLSKDRTATGATTSNRRAANGTAGLTALTTCALSPAGPSPAVVSTPMTTSTTAVLSPPTGPRPFRLPPGLFDDEDDESVPSRHSSWHSMQGTEQDRKQEVELQRLHDELYTMMAEQLPQQLTGAMIQQQQQQHQFPQQLPQHPYPQQEQPNKWGFGRKKSDGSSAPLNGAGGSSSGAKNLKNGGRMNGNGNNNWDQQQYRPTRRNNGPKRQTRTTAVSAHEEKSTTCPSDAGGSGWSESSPAGPGGATAADQQLPPTTWRSDESAGVWTTTTTHPVAVVTGAGSAALHAYYWTPLVPAGWPTAAWTTTPANDQHVVHHGGRSYSYTSGAPVVNDGTPGLVYIAAPAPPSGGEQEHEVDKYVTNNRSRGTRSFEEIGHPAHGKTNSYEAWQQQQELDWSWMPSGLRQERGSEGDSKIAETSIASWETDAGTAYGLRQEERSEDPSIASWETDAATAYARAYM